MIPETVGTVLVFLGLVAPGLTLELLQERRRPTLSQTAFREASRIALSSLVFTTIAIALLLAVRAAKPELVADPAAWLVGGNAYVKAYFGLATGTLVAEVAIAAGLAILADRFLSGSQRGVIRAGGIWFQTFRARCPEGATPWIHLKLVDGMEIWGFVGDYTTEDKLAERELTVFGPKLRYRRDGKDENLDAWASVCVRGDSIAWMKVTYVADDSPEDVPMILPALRPT